MRDTGGQLAERGEFLGLHQAILRGPQILQRLCQFAGAGLNAFKQAYILDRDRRLVGEGRDQLDLLVGEWAHLLARQCQNADCPPSRSIGTPRAVRSHPNPVPANVYSGSALTSGI